MWNSMEFGRTSATTSPGVISARDVGPEPPRRAPPRGRSAPHLSGAAPHLSGAAPPYRVRWRPRGRTSRTASQRARFALRGRAERDLDPSSVLQCTSAVGRQPPRLYQLPPARCWTCRSIGWLVDLENGGVG